MKQTKKSITGLREKFSKETNWWMRLALIRARQNSERARCCASGGTPPKERTQLYRITEFIGKWSMTDVFVVAILVALIQMGGLLRITAGPAAIAFGGVVIVTMIAAESFDPRLIWDRRELADG